MNPAKQPSVRLSGPTPFSVGSLESLSNEELAQRKTEALDALQRICDEEHRRRWGHLEPLPTIRW
jgi:hypothetical protein